MTFGTVNLHGGGLYNWRRSPIIFVSSRYNVIPQAHRIDMSILATVVRVPCFYLVIIKLFIVSKCIPCVVMMR